MVIRTFNYTCPGATHIKSGKPCQDYSAVETEDDFAIAVVSDGHGGNKYFRSGDGSRIACDVSIDIVKKFINEIRKDDMDSNSFNYKLLFRQLATKIINEWQKQVEEHFADNEIAENEKLIYETHYTEDAEDADIHKIYGATIVLAVISDDMSFVIQTGDSPCLVFNDDYECRIPQETINPDCVMDYTTSLSDSNAINNFRYFWTTDMPKAIFVCSDGIKDSYSEDDFLNFGTVLLKEFEKDYTATIGFIEEWLPKLSERGSGDDMSIAGIIININNEFINVT
jgi:serine/threonine protein phosphatase PrpC